MAWLPNCLPLASYGLLVSKTVKRDAENVPTTLGALPIHCLSEAPHEHSRLVPIFPLHRCKYKHLRTQLGQIHNVGLPLGYSTNPGISDHQTWSSS